MDTRAIARPLRATTATQFTAGIAAALATATAVFGCGATDAVRDALVWEVRAHDEKLGSWPDLRESSVLTTCMHDICSGAPGIGLASLVAARLEDALAREYASTLIRASTLDGDEMETDRPSYKKQTEFGYTHAGEEVWLGCKIIVSHRGLSGRQA